jgi:hypothetical protein
MEVSGQLHYLPLDPQGKSPWYSFECRPQSRFRHGEEKNSHSLPGLWVRNSLPVMEPESSLLYSQRPTGPIPELQASSPHSHTVSSRSIVILPSHLHLVLPSFPNKTVAFTLNYIKRASCPVHFILLEFYHRNNI